MSKLSTLAALALLAPLAARAQIGVGARLGYAVPTGDAFESSLTGERTSMSSQWSSELPLQLDVSYRLRPNLALGAYASYASADVGGELRATCTANGYSCSARTIRIGIEGFYRLGELTPRFFPWAGAGIGWEWTRFEAGVPGQMFDGRFSGVELLGLQVGLEYQPNPHFAFGPYAMASLGVYTAVASGADGFSTLEEPMRRRLHEWISVGVRVRIEP